LTLATECSTNYQKKDQKKLENICNRAEHKIFESAINYGEMLRMLAKFKKIDGMENVMVILCVDGLQNLRTMAPKIVLSIMLLQHSMASSFHQQCLQFVSAQQQLECLLSEHLQALL